jgi:predicted regulator of Ras-like GTPase activity (Roadblock/LC7/MglB family)
MGPAEALAELTELSSQVVAAAILDESGSVLASTGPERGEELARTAAELLAAAADVRPAGPAVTRVEVALPGGSLFVVSEGGRVAVATTVPEPTPGLVVYDLRTALRRVEEGDAVPEPAAKPKRSRKAADA